MECPSLAFPRLRMGSGRGADRRAGGGFLMNASAPIKRQARKHRPGPFDPWSNPSYVFVKRESRKTTPSKPLSRLGGNVMWRIVALCWVFTAPALAGALVIAVLVTPQLATDAGLWIPIAALLGALYGVPAACCIARFVDAPAAPQATALRRGWGLSA